MRSVLVVGASVAGIASVRALRRQGFDGRVLVVGEEDETPYDRPPLSKGYLAGEVAREDLMLEQPDRLQAWDAEWHLGRRAVALEPGSRSVLLDDGSRLSADGLVIATGARGRTLPASILDPTGSGAGVHVLRTRADADALRADLVPGARLVVVGGGFIGAEVAATARARGVSVELVEADTALLRRQFGPELSPVWLDLHRRNGVTVSTGVGLASVERRHGRLIGVRLRDGRSLAADAVLLAVGATPNTEWLAGSGLRLEDGVLCDAVGRTGLPDVVAVGDVTRAPHAFVGATVRIEHWGHAMSQPALAVAALLGGQPVAPTAPPTVWSDQYDAHLLYAGHRGDHDVMEVVDGDLGSDAFTVLFRADGAPRAVLSVNQPRVLGRVKRTLAPHDGAGLDL